MQQVKRIVSILEMLGDNTDGLGLTELSIKIGLPKSTTCRILKSLMQYNMAAQDSETKKYKLGLQILMLGNKLLKNICISEIARPYLINIRDEFDETVFLSVLDNNRVTCVEKFDTRKKLRYFVQVGNTMPFNCAASSKVIIAFQDEKNLNEIISNMKFLRYTDCTIYNQKKLFQEYKSIKNCGYAVCNEEMENLVMGIAAPIFDYKNEVKSSICILGLKSSFKGKKLNAVINTLLDASGKISEEWSRIKNRE